MVDRDPQGLDLAVARGCQALGSMARESVDGLVPEAESGPHIAARADLLAALDARPRRSRRPPRRAASPWMAFFQAAAVSLLVCLGGAGLWSLLSERPIQYVVEGHNEGSGRHLRAGDDALSVRFSEGSEVVLEPGAAARVAEVTASGARIVAHEGRLRARIEPLDGADWTVEAGPFAVHVTGTEFSVAWEPTTYGLVVDLYQGSLRVTGPQSAEGVAIHAGQRLTASGGAGTMTLADMPSASNEGLEPTAQSAGAAVAGRTSEPQGADAPTKAGAEEGDAGVRGSWRDRVGAGRFQEVLAEAEREGIETVLSARSLEDISALADAARYAHRSELAGKILLTQRKRFPSSPQATTAAYLLGRLAEVRGATGEAMLWYSRYRLEAPTGALAEEALGRLVVLLGQSGQDEAAREAARQYLASYPSGASAAAARAILGDP